MSGSCADRNTQYMNAGRPCHRDLQIVVEHKRDIAMMSGY